MTTPKPDEFAGLTREMLITQILQLRDLVTMEQANLATRDRMMDEMANKIVAEQTAKERAEARVKELSDVLGEVLEALRVHAPGTALNSREFDSLGCKARAILAARAKEGEKR